MSGKGKDVSLTSSKIVPGKARILSLSEEGSSVKFNAEVVAQGSSWEMAKQMLDPLARAIEEAGSEKHGVDVVVVSDEGEKRIYVESKPGGRRAGKPGKKPGFVAYRLLKAVPPVPISFSTSELAEQMLPQAPVPSPAQAILAQRESLARWDMLEEFGAYTSEEIADRRSRAKNRHALANRWRSEGRTFAVEVRGLRLYPGFQFDAESFDPEPVVSTVLETLPRDLMSDWEVALWWVAANPWLEDSRPVDVMHEDPEAVTAAAAHLAEPSPL